MSEEQCSLLVLVYTCTSFLQQSMWQQLPADKQQEMIQHEENAVFNQVVLFVSRVIWLRCPLDYPEGK